MACLVSDILVSGVDDGAGGAASITVSGSADDCDSGRVLVKLFCAGTPVGAVSGAVIDGAWSVTFEDPPCTCGNEVRVEAECEGQPDCRTIEVTALVCRPPEGECPAVDSVEVAVADCSDGLRQVTFTITTNAPAASVAELEFGDGDSDAFVVAEGIDTNEVTHSYSPGAYGPALSFLLPEGCPPIALEAVDIAPCCLQQDEIDWVVGDCVDGLREVTFGFPGLVAGRIDFGDGEQAGFEGLRQTHRYEPREQAYHARVTLDGCDPLEIDVDVEACPVDCLVAADVSVVVGEACDNERRRTVTLLFPRAIQAAVDFGDGSDVLDVDSDHVVHDYPARVSPTASYTATVSPGGDCPPVELQIELPACPCVASEQLQLDAADDCDANGNRVVTLTLPWEANGEIEWGDGQREPFVAQVLTHAYQPAGAPYRVVVSIAGCGPVERDVDVPACGDGGGGGGGDDDCGNLRYVVAALLGLALAAALLLITLQFCLAVAVPWFVWLLPATLAATAGVVIALWFALCDPPTRCDWLFIAWAVPLVGGIVALYLSGCCPGFMLGLSIGFFAVAGAAFVAWLAVCRPSGCEILRGLALAISTAAGGILGAIGTAAVVVPPLMACLLHWVAFAVGLLVAALVPAALFCRD